MASPTAMREPRTRRGRPRRSHKPVCVGFLCYGNGCRSQMAEAWARHYAPGRIVAQSAGLHPLGEIPPETRAVMAEKGVSLEGQYSKGLDAIDWERVDVVVNMASYPTAAFLPRFTGQTIDWKVTDPFLEPVDVYRSVRDDLEGRVRSLIEGLTDRARRPPKTL